MKVVLSAIFLVLSLVCGVQGQAECVQEEYDDFWEGGSGPMLCGCQLYDPSDTPLVNISLDFFDTLTVKHDADDVIYSYSPCSGNTSCDNAAVCRHVRVPPSHKSIGMLDNVNYTVNNIISVNISATYLGEDGTSSVVFLVCDETAKDKAKFSFMRRDESKIYYFQLSYDGFCVPLVPTTTTMTTTKSTTTTMTTNSTTTTMTTNSTTTTMTTNSTTTTMTTTTNSTKTMTTTKSTNTTMTPTMTITSTTANSPTSNPSENKNDKDRKVVLGVVLSIVGAIIVGVILAIVVYFLWKKKRGASYEKIPTM